MSTPDPNRFDWALVRSFLAVLDAGSLMGAARRGVTPTAAALAIADAARQMEAGALTLSRSLTTARNAETGTVRITTSEVAATWLLPPLLARLDTRARHPRR